MMDDLAKQSQQVIKKGSKSFSLAAQLFNKDVRDSASLLYSWCRYCDDLIDGQHLGFPGYRTQDTLTPSQQIARITEQTHRVLDGRRTDELPFQALQAVVDKHGISSKYPLELLQGFQMDVNGSTYETIEETLHYCYLVAGVVGIMMAQIMGVRDKQTLSHAADLGTAFQLTNIARDVLEDATIGRVYLPNQWLREAGLVRDDLTDRSQRKALFSVTERLIRFSDSYYQSAVQGIQALPFRSAWAVSSAYFIYRDIGLNILKHGEASLEGRLVVRKRRKVFRLLQAGLWSGSMGFARWTKSPFSKLEAT